MGAVSYTQALLSLLGERCENLQCYDPPREGGFSRGRLNSLAVRLQVWCVVPTALLPRCEPLRRGLLQHERLAVEVTRQIESPEALRNLEKGACSRG